MEKRSRANFISLTSSMYSLVFNGETINVSIASLVATCHLFQTKPGLLGQPNRVESGVSPDLLRVFAGAINGAAAEISAANVRDLLQLCDEFKFIELAKRVTDWQVEHPLINAGIRRELHLTLEERLESHAWMVLISDQALHRGREAAISDAEKLGAMEAEVSGLRMLLGETAASEQKAERDINLVRTAAAEQRWAHGRDICAVEEEIRRLREAIAGVGGSLGQQEGEWNAAIGDLLRKAKEERHKVSGLRMVLGNLEGKHEQLQAAFARQAD
jgi:hypothetical protein